MNNSKNEKISIWNRYFIISCLVCLFTGFAMNMMNSTMAKYIYSVYSNTSLSGLLNAAFAILAIIGRVISGNLSDKLGRRFIIICGGCIFAVSLLFFGMFPYVAALILLRGLQGFGYSSCSTANYAAGSDVLPTSRMGEGIGYMGLGYSLAMAIGPAIALKLVDISGYNSMFAATTAMVILAVILAIFNNYEKNPSYLRPGKADNSKFRGLSRFIEPKALPATIVQLFHCLSFAAVNYYIVVYAESRGISGTAFFFTCMAIAMCLTRLFAGRVSDKVGVVAVVLPCLCVTAFGFLLLIFSSSATIFYITGFLMGISTGVANPVLQAAAVKASPSDRTGSANGTYQLSNDVANGLGALIWGFMIDISGYTITFSGCIICIAISAVLLVLFYRKKSSPVQ